MQALWLCKLYTGWPWLVWRRIFLLCLACSAAGNIRLLLHQLRVHSFHNMPVQTPTQVICSLSRDQRKWADRCTYSVRQTTDRAIKCPVYLVRRTALKGYCHTRGVSWHNNFIVTLVWLWGHVGLVRNGRVQVLADVHWIQFLTLGCCYHFQALVTNDSFVVISHTYLHMN
jgi:hypothetical protein